MRANIAEPKMHASEKKKRRANILLRPSVVATLEPEYAASIKPPQLDRGLKAAACAPIHIPVTRAIELTPESSATSVGTVGMRVGITTPEAEETQDITPAKTVIIAAAVLSPIR